MGEKMHVSRRHQKNMMAQLQFPYMVNCSKSPKKGQSLASSKGRLAF